MSQQFETVVIVEGIENQLASLEDMLDIYNQVSERGRY